MHKAVTRVFLILAVVACAHSGPVAVQQDSSFSVRVLEGSPDAPVRIVAINSDGTFVDSFLGGTHMAPPHTSKGALRPGELNDIKLTIEESGFWTWPSEPEDPSVWGVALEVEQGARHRRVFQADKRTSPESKVRTLVAHIRSFLRTGA
jgi:hypothetical protein